MDDDRCPYVTTCADWTSNPRDDGWRCGHTVGHTGSHELFGADGERVLWVGAAPWVLPEVAR
jgi:hypothetical protein